MWEVLLIVLPIISALSAGTISASDNTKTTKQQFARVNHVKITMDEANKLHTGLSVN